MKSVVIENGGSYTYFDKSITKEEKQFLSLAHNDRPTLLDRLQGLELLPSFLEAENETMTEF